MENRAKNTRYQLGDLSGAAIKRQAWRDRQQERFSWLGQLAVAAVLIGLIVWACVALRDAFVPDLSATVSTLMKVN